MSIAPVYFEAIRQKAAHRWNQLEGDPELAGPWHQLFKQVQSPRHILSELLQNADDAGATAAAVRVENGVFVFEHNGEDFRDEHFASLCRFGYSNKRALHTIGFRGIGFKSTFSLGDRVELFTPTLSVAFHRRRFTEPLWICHNQDRCSRTQVRVAISNPLLQHEVERNLADWRESPVSLLFFKHIRRLRIGEHDLKWDIVGPGPVADSVRMTLNGEREKSYLLLTSNTETFPDDALAEIQQERMVDNEEHGAFPPCSVQVVLGATNRLYVVLPTGVETELPFACNAPFVQDPARLKIKDPETSPTNRWLLQRCGTLAASAMLGWLGRSDSSEEARAQAYGLLPDVDRDASSLEGTCAAIVENAFALVVADQNVLLSETGTLLRAKQCVAIPRRVQDVWSPMPVASLLDQQGRPSLSVHVAASERLKLRNWELVEEIEKPVILALLKERSLPKPNSWSKLLSLWTYIAPDITGYRYFTEPEKLKIFPVSRGDELLSAAEVVRLGDRHLLQSEDDWDFIRGFVTVVDEDWIGYLSLQRAAAKHDPKPQSAEATAAADAVLVKLGLASPSDVAKVFSHVAAEFFSADENDRDDCVRLAQIAAKLSANVASEFWFVTRDGDLRSADEALYFDADGALEALLPEARCESQMLCAEYAEAFRSCSRDEWSTWIRSGRSGLRTAPEIAANEKRFTSSSGFLGYVRKVAPNSQQVFFPYTSHRSYPYQRYVLGDFDFDADCVVRWNATPNDEHVWAKIVDVLANSPESVWSDRLLLQAEQTSTNGLSSATVDIGPVPAAWVRRLRMLPCLPDTHGFPRRPDELLRRTSETEALMGVEPFLDHRLDRAALVPLLDALGVRTTASGPERLLDALRALSQTPSPPVTEVDKWYRRLDQFLETCSTEDNVTVVSAFLGERLIFSQEEAWATSRAVYLLSGEDDVPEVSVIRATVADLALWRRVGVAERPTVERAIAWLVSLAPGYAPVGADLRRIRALLARYPGRIWHDCGHWLNLQGEWSPTSALKYALTMQSLVPWSHLFPWVKQQTADLRFPGDVTRDEAFVHLPLLAACVEERMENRSLFSSRHESREWLRTFGIELLRIELDSDEETQRVRDLATRLATTKWTEARGLELAPYIAGTPAGTTRSADVVWIDDQLFAEVQSRAKLAKRVPEELAKPFNRQDIRSALDYCFERAVDDVREYLRENFALTHVASATEAEELNGGKGNDVSSDIVLPNADADVPSFDCADVNTGNCVTDDTAASSPAALPEPVNDTDSRSPERHEDRRAGRSREVSTQERLSLIERFAAQRGFQTHGDGGFAAANGERLIRSTASAFAWEHYSRDGQLLRSYFAKDHCLEHEPLELDAGVWGLLDKLPATHSMLLLDTNSAPVEMTGVELRALRDANKITLYPAAYRLVLEHPKHV